MSIQTDTITIRDANTHVVNLIDAMLGDLATKRLPISQYLDVQNRLTMPAATLSKLRHLSQSHAANTKAIAHISALLGQI
ncbi:MAG: hypothetical protein ACPGRX_02425 [Bdellovibrionales bacterium]